MIKPLKRSESILQQEHMKVRENFDGDKRFWTLATMAEWLCCLVQTTEVRCSNLRYGMTLHSKQNRVFYRTFKKVS
jgi:hypothetical protein